MQDACTVTVCDADECFGGGCRCALYDANVLNVTELHT